MCVSDNGTELTGMAILRWSQSMQVDSAAVCLARCSTIQLRLFIRADQPNIHYPFRLLIQQQTMFTGQLYQY
jgi:hypothetical protein